MAGIGHKVCVRAANVSFRGFVRQFDYGHIVVDILAADAPDVASARQAFDHRCSVSLCAKQSDGFRLAKNHSRILTNDMTAKHPAGSIICSRNFIGLRDQQGRLRVFNEWAHRFDVKTLGLLLVA